MQRVEGIIQPYEPGPYPAHEPILHVGFLAHVLCSVPVSGPRRLDEIDFSDSFPGEDGSDFTVASGELASASAAMVTVHVLADSNKLNR